MDKTVKHIHQKGYSKGYNAGIKRRGREMRIAQVENDRLTHLAASIICAGMQGGWGVTKDGEFKKHDLKRLEVMAVESAQRND